MSGRKENNGVIEFVPNCSADLTRFAQIRFVKNDGILTQSLGIQSLDPRLWGVPAQLSQDLTKPPIP